MDLINMTIAGRLVNDPEQNSAGTVVNFRVASSTKTGKERDKEETLYLDVVAFGKLVAAAMTHLRKGMPVIVVGRLRCREWQKQGEQQKRYNWELIANNVGVSLFAMADGGDGRRQSGPPAPPERPARPTRSADTSDPEQW